jgi:hypothetical protein
VRARIALILGIALSALAAVDREAAASADPRSQEMRFDLLREGPTEACGSSCGAWVSAIGVITEDTPSVFERFATQHDIRGTAIALNSAGGSVRGGLLLGRAIRKLEMITTVGKAIDLPPQPDGVQRAILSPWAACESICAFVLLAGVERHVPVEAQVRVHDIWLGDRRNNATKATYSAEDVAVVQQDVVQLARYTAEMGGTFALLEVALNVPPWEPMHQLSRAELVAMNMATIDNWHSGRAFSPARSAMPAAATALLGPSLLGSEGGGAKPQLGTAANPLPD